MDFLCHGILLKFGGGQSTAREDHVIFLFANVKDNALNYKEIFIGDDLTELVEYYKYSLYLV